MRPVRLTMKGLRSYREATTIEFHGLDLFAVIGDTGAGKSTLIEALVFALYAKKTWNSGRLEELVAEGQTKVAVELVFDADGRRWTVTRGRGSGAPVDRLECEGEPGTVNGADEVKGRIERLLGLDSEQFMNAVLMRQGKFDELLTLSATKRNTLLASIFGLAPLEDIREWARTTLKLLDKQLGEASGARKALPVDPSAAVAEAQLAADAALVEHDRLQGWSREVGEHLAGLEEAQRGVERIELRRSALPDAARAPLDRIGALRPIAAQMIADRVALVEQERSTAAVLEGLRLRLAEAHEGFIDRDAVVRAAESLRSTARAIADAEPELVEAVARLAEMASTPDVTTVDPVLEQAVAEAAAREAELDAARAAARGRLDAARALWVRLRDRSASLVALVPRLGEAEGVASEAKVALAAADLAVEEAEQVLRSAREAREAAERADAVAHVVQGCAAGDACPVCDRPLEEAHLTRHGTLDPGIAAAVRSAEERVRAATAARTAAVVASNEATQRTAALQEQLQVAERELEEVTAACAAAGVVVSADDEGLALASLQQAVDEAEEGHRVGRAATERARSALVAAETTLGATRAERAREVERLEARRDKAIASISAARRRIEPMPEVFRPEPEAAPELLVALAERLDHVAAAIRVVAQEQESASALAEQARDVRAAFDQRAVDEVRDPARQALATLDGWVRRVAELAADVPGSEGSASALVPLGSLTMVAELDDAHTRAVAVVDAADRLLEMADAHRARLAEVVAAARSAIDAILVAADRASVDALREALGGARIRLDHTQEAVATAQRQSMSAAALDEQLALLGPICADLDTLHDALAPSAFVKHLVAERTRELLDEASRRLAAITAGTYEFGDDFAVVEVRTGAVRRPEMLSGGERFQAALALSLALVEIAARGGGRIDAVFVDEGFGSLDTRSLRQALDTLGGVAGGGKMVGLISHLKPVAEFVDTVFHVTKDDALGSRIARLDGVDREALLYDEGDAGLSS